MIFCNVCITFSNMKFVSMCHRFWDGFWYIFWCFFDTFTLRTCNLLKHKKHVFFNEFQRFYPSEKHVFWWFSWFFWYQFGHWFFMRFGIDFGNPLASKSMVLGDHFFIILGMVFLWILNQNWPQKTLPPLFRKFSFFDPVPLVVFSKVPWLTLTPFWFPFGSMLVVLDTLFDQF